MKILKSIFMLACPFLFFASLPLRAQNCAAVIKVNENLNGRTLESVAYHGGYSMAVGEDGLVMLSTDGRTWIDLNSGTTDDFVDVVWAGDRFALMANRLGVTTIWTWDPVDGLVALTDLISTVTGKEGHALGWAPPNLIIAYMDNLFVRGEIQTTQDFVTLSENDINRNSHCGRITEIDTVNGVTAMGFQCLDSNGFAAGSGVYFSQDGMSYPSIRFNNLDMLGCSGMATNGAIVFASASTWIPGNGWVSHFYHSPSLGVPFTEYPEDGSMRTLTRDADWVDPFFVGVGPIGVVLTSLDGLAWHNTPSPNTGIMRSITPFEDGFFLAVGENETILLGTVEAYVAILDTWPENADCRDLILGMQNCLAP